MPTNAHDPLARYVSKRKRSDLLQLDVPRLLELLRVLPRKRLAGRFGTWLKPRGATKASGGERAGQ